jgi:hypothetical protein
MYIHVSKCKNEKLKCLKKKKKPVNTPQSFYFQVRERLRVALERCSLLEEELGATHKEVSWNWEDLILQKTGGLQQ